MLKNVWSFHDLKKLRKLPTAGRIYSPKVKINMVDKFWMSEPPFHLIIQVPNCPFLTLGAKLSVLTLGAKLSVLTLVAKLSGAKLS